MILEPARGRLNWAVFSEKRSIFMGFAITIIMLFHWCENYSLLVTDWWSSEFVKTVFGRLINIFAWIGACGVEIFLFLSGIGLYFSFSKRPDVLSFYKKRFVTILVPYFLIAAPYLIWQNFIYTDRGIFWLFKDLFLLTSFTPFNRQCWYISMILFCYVIFPVLYYAIKRWGVFGVILLESVTMLLPFIVQVLDPEVFNLYQVGLTRIPSFVLGVYCGEKVKNNDPVKRFPFIVFGFAVFMYVLGHIAKNYGISRTIFFRYEKGALMLVFLFVAAWMTEKLPIHKLNKLLIFFSPMTLELYLTHVEVRRMFARLFTNCWTISNVTLAYVSILFISIPIAYYVHSKSGSLIKYLCNQGK